jgi:hypothetical protein
VRTFGAQRYPGVGLDNGGDFVVTWQTYADDGNSYGVFARRFTSSGPALGGEFLVNAYTSGAQRFPSIEVDGDGDFVIAWQSYGQDGSVTGVFAQRFNSLGQRLQAEFQVNTHTNLGQSGTYGAGTNLAPPGISINPSGDFVVAWHSYAQDGVQGGIFAQRFDNFAVLDIDGNGDTQALTDGLLVLRFLFGFSGGTLTAGAVDTSGCFRCDAASISAYLETLL